MKCYLVTGGAGFIGSNYIHFLMRKYSNRIRIINLDALTYCANRENVREYEGISHYEFIEGDVCDEELIAKILKENDIDYVVHFAAQTHVDRSIDSAKEFAKTNVMGTLNLLNAVLKAWTAEEYSLKRFLYVSTDEVYGELPAEGSFTEESSLCPRNPYSASKAGGDMMARAFYETHNLPVLVSRCSNNYGPYQYEEKLIPLCIKYCLSGKEIPIYGDGQNIRDWLYVEDHCKAIDQILSHGKPGEIYNIGANNELTNLDLVNSMRRILTEEFRIQAPPIRFVKDRKGHDRRYAICPGKIKRELGWKVDTAFEDGIRQTISWYINQG